MKKIAYIIGHRNSTDPNRTRNLQLVLNWLINLKEILLKNNISLKIIVIEQDDSPKIKNIDNEKITHIFVYNPGFYNRGWAFNVGYKLIDADYYFFGDNDIILKNECMLHVLTKCFKYDAVNPYSKIYDTTNEYVESNSFDPCIYDPMCENLFDERRHTCFAGGIVGLSGKSVHIVKGWDERFRGRGWEDYAFTAKLKLFLCKLHTFKFFAIHLWHEKELGIIKEKNSKLNKEYQSYDVKNYIKQIENSYGFGSPIKYSQFGKKQKGKYNLHYRDRIKHAYCIYNEAYNYVTKKYKLVKDKKRLYTYLDLCDQLCNYDPDENSSIHESGMRESGDVRPHSSSSHSH